MILLFVSFIYFGGLVWRQLSLSYIVHIFVYGPAEARFRGAGFSPCIGDLRWPSAVFRSLWALLSLWHIPAHFHSQFYAKYQFEESNLLPTVCLKERSIPKGYSNSNIKSKKNLMMEWHKINIQKTKTVYEHKSENFRISNSPPPFSTSQKK